MPASGLRPLLRTSATFSPFRWSVVRCSSTLIGRGPFVKGSRRRGLSLPHVPAAYPTPLSLMAPGRRSMMMAPPFPLPWDARTKASEEAELELYRRFSSLCSFLDTDVHLPEDSPFRKWLADKSGVIRSGFQGDAKKEVEVLAQMLKEAQAVLVELEKAKISAFKREWWRPESVDYQDARLALHYSALRHLVTLLLAEPIIPNPSARPQGQSTASPTTPLPVSQLILNVVESWMDGGLDQRLKAYWPLCDSDHDGYLSQPEMDKAVYGNVKPLELALRECFLTVPSLTKKQKKKFEKYMKYYSRDQEDYPNKLRCIFAWAQKSRDAPKDEDKRITYDEYLATQKEYFASLGKTSQECITLFAKTRVYDHEVSAENRETIRLGFIYFILLAASDIWVSTV